MTAFRSMKLALRNARRTVGSFIASDVIEEAQERARSEIRRMKDESEKEMKAYKSRIDEYVDYFMRCKIERDRGYSTRMRVMVEYDAEPFGFTNESFSPHDSTKREFMAREIAWKVQKELASARLVVPPKENRRQPFVYDAGEGVDIPLSPSH